MKNWKPENIMALRKRHKLTRKTFSDLLGVAGNHVYLLERGLRQPSRTLQRLLDYIEKDLNENEKEKEE